MVRIHPLDPKKEVAISRKHKPQTPEQREAAIARSLANPKAKAYRATLADTKKPKHNFVMIHDPKHYGCFTERLTPPVPKKKGDGYTEAMRRVHAVMKRYPLAPAPPMPTPEPMELASMLPKNRIVKRYGKEPVLLKSITNIQLGRCILCGDVLDLSIKRLPHITEPDMATIEHVVPRSRGGKDRGNRLVTHRICNERKANSPPTGCELVWLLAVNAKLGVEPVRW